MAYSEYPAEMLVELTGIYTVHYFEFAKEFVDVCESHNFWEMVYVDSGSIDVYSDNEMFQLSQGDVYLHAPGETHKLAGDRIKAANIMIVSFACKSGNDSMDMLSLVKRVHKTDTWMRRILAQLLSEARMAFELPFNEPSMTHLTAKPDRPSGSVQAVVNWMELFLILLIRPLSKKNELSAQYAQVDSLFSETVRILSGHIYDSFPKDELVKKLNYSLSHMSHYFTESCGCTLHRYYMQMKISEAKKLMRQTTLNIKEISAKLNFCNEHYFSRVFRRYTNMTPREYWNSVKI